MAEYDLTSKVGCYLDRHLVFPLLEFLSERDIFDEQDLQKGKLELLSNTNMVDFAMDVYKTLYEDEVRQHTYDRFRSIHSYKSIVLESAL